MKLQELKEKRAAKLAEMRSLHAKDKLEDNEETRFKALEIEVSSLDDQIKRAERMAEFERLEAEGEHIGGNGEMRRELRNYSLAKATTESLAGKLSGLEAEMHQELSKGRETRGLMVPVDILLGGAERRAITTTTPLAGPGGNLVRTDLASMTDRRRPALKVEMLGATVLRGLTGNLDLPRLAASGTAHWIAEHTNTTGSDAQFEKKSMTPKTVSGEYELSRRMLLQSQEAIETILRGDLGLIMAQALDLAAIKGGGANEPTGIMSEIAAGTDSTLSSDTTADMIAELETDDVTGTRAFLTHPGVINLARKIKETTTNRVVPIAETFHGERVEGSTQVPVVTAGTPNTYALIFGEWASVYVGYWSGVDILLNPYASNVASKGGVMLHAFLDTDVVVRHPEGFNWREITG